MVGACHTLPPWMLSQWTLGGVLAQLPAPSVAPLFDTMLDLSADAFGIGLDLISMYVHRAQDRLEELRPQIRKAAENVTRWTPARWPATACVHFEQIMRWMLTKGREDADACATALTLARAAVRVDDFNLERAMRGLFSELLARFPEITLPLLSQAIVSDRRVAWRMEHFLGGRRRSGSRQDPPLLSLPEDALFAWCHAHPESVPAFVSTILPVLTPCEVVDAAPFFHPTMARMLGEFGDREDVLHAVGRNIHTFTWSGPVTSYFSLYDAPLSSLRDNHQNPKVRRWAERTRSGLAALGQSMQDRDDEREAQWRL